MDFTLPALTQESFSRWYNKQVPRTDNVDERIVYPGVKLNCSTKSRDLRSVIMPRHVFVTQEIGTNTFHHKVLGSNNTFVSLPKRLYSHCFRNINIHSIPTDNRIIVRLTENTSVTLPYIPDDFVDQKRSKRSGTSRSRGVREAKRVKREAKKTEMPYTGWVTQVLSPATEQGADQAIDSFSLLSYIRNELRKNDLKLDASMPNPFSGLPTIEKVKENKMELLTGVIQFVHHYGRHI
tara:strand:- start:1686 stop:2396 length:711 start_codon:yes stop_codon:yes gene_type:complete